MGDAADDLMAFEMDLAGIGGRGGFDWFDEPIPREPSGALWHYLNDDDLEMGIYTLNDLAAQLAVDRTKPKTKDRKREPKTMARTPAKKNTNKTVALPDDIAEGLANMGAVARQDNAGDNGTFMKFKKGSFLFGTDAMETEEGSRWAVNPRSFIHGYQAWGDGELLGEEVAGMNDVPVVKGDLDTHTYVHPETKTEVNAKWDPLRGFQLVCVKGEDIGLQCFLKGVTLGMTNAVTGLIEEIVAHVRDEDAGTPVPIVELESDSYMHKKRGEIFFPIFTVVDWVDMQATEVPEPDDADPEGDDGNDDGDDGQSTDDAAAEAEEAQALQEAEDAQAAADAAAADGDAKPPTRRRRRRAAS